MIILPLVLAASDLDSEFRAIRAALGMVNRCDAGLAGSSLLGVLVSSRRPPSGCCDSDISYYRQRCSDGVEKQVGQFFVIGEKGVAVLAGAHVFNQCDHTGKRRGYS